jgi:microcystin degradation protein MlrC
MRLAVGGFQHETNTFAPVGATYESFVEADAWPGLVRGADLLEAVRGINLPAAGFIQAATAAHHTIVPLTWCSATPSARVTKDAYERIASHIIEDIRAAGAIDAVYLDLHGAMAAEHIDDADGELLRRVSSLVGSSIPIIATLDFHANVSAQMVEQASLLVSYRTYPHTDMAATGERALKMLVDTAGQSLVSRLHQLPFLIPLPSQCTLLPPLSEVMEEVERLERAPVVALNFTPGFPASDVEECGPSVFGYGSKMSDVENTTSRIRHIVMERESEFRLDIYSIDEALAELKRMTTIRGRPTILADTQDNPGGGGTSDTTSLLKAIAASPIERVLAGLIFDPVAAEHAHESGTGAFIDVELGAHSGTPGETPFAARFEVIAIGDGKFAASGPFYAGARMNLGRMALLRIGELYIAVSSRKQQAADQAMFHHLNVDPRDFNVLILKSSVHFRAAFAPIAHRILLVEAPGANVADPSKLPFKNLRAEMRSGSPIEVTP